LWTVSPQKSAHGLQVRASGGDGGLYVTPNTSANVTTSAGATTQGRRGQNRQDNMQDYGNEEPSQDDVQAVGKVLDDRD